MTISDWTWLLAFTLAIFLTLGISEFIRRIMRWSPEATRKLVHMFVGILVATTPFLLDSMWPMVIIGVTFAILDFIAIRFGFFQGMHGTSRITYGTVFYPISFVLLTLTLWQNHKLILVIAMLIMAISDAMAAIVGENVKRPIEFRLGAEKKSVQGSIAMFLTTLLIVLGAFAVAAELQLLALSSFKMLWIALVVAIVATMSETISAQGSDNLTVPLGAAFTLYYMLTESTHEAMVFTLGMILAALIGFVSYRLRFLNKGGSVALFLLGTLVFGVGRWTFSAPILAFFVLSSVLSKLGKNRKLKLVNVFEKSSQRDAAQVLANGGIAGLMLVLWYYTKSDTFYVLYIASLASVTADTWATEIGVMAKGQPRSILNFKPVPMGTSGGVSWLGTTGALLGSAVLVGVGFLSSPHSSPRAVGISEAAIILIAGLVASMVDSVLGATVQAQFKCTVCGKITEKKLHCQNTQTHFAHGWRWINNDVVNGVCAASGVLFAWLILLLI